MTEQPRTIEEAIAEIEELRARLEEAEDGIRAIRSGEVDAVVVSGPQGEQVYTLMGAERTYRILVEAMNEGALVLSPEGVIIYCNRTFADMLGAPIYDLLGHAVYEFVSKADVKPLKRMLAETPLRPGRREIGLKHFNASTVPASLSVGHLDHEDGPSVSAVVTDLTEHKRTEAELKQYRNNLEALVVERTWDLLSANEALHITSEELRAEIEQRKETEQSLADAQGDAERRAAQMESFVGSMADGITLFDADGTAVMMNDVGRAIFGVPPDEGFNDWSKYERYTMDGQPISMENAASFRALRGETIRNMRYRAVTPWGKDFIMSVSAAPVLDCDGKVIGATKVFRDVTDVVEMEQQRHDLFRREHHISQTLQKALIPSQAPYELLGVSIATRYQPALKEAEVGGDFYDVFELDDGKIGILIGDVVGKGLQAAVSVAAARHSFRSYAYLNASPAKVMTLTNAALLRGTHDIDNLMTAIFAVLDVSKWTLTYASAGHEPPIVFNGGSEVDELSVTGTMLGIVPGTKYDEEVRQLSAGDNVVMFTDGITEARPSASNLFTKSGVIAHLMGCGDASADSIAETLLEAAKTHAGGSLQDDAAIVVLGRSPA